jgi:hypothetical protein
MELGHLPYKKHTYEHHVGRAGLERKGQKTWRRLVADVAERLLAALRPDDTVIGGGNVKKLKALPPYCRPGDNANAFRGGFRLWVKDNVAPPDVSPARVRSERKAGASRTDAGDLRKLRRRNRRGNSRHGQSISHGTGRIHQGRLPATGEQL